MTDPSHIAAEQRLIGLALTSSLDTAMLPAACFENPVHGLIWQRIEPLGFPETIEELMPPGDLDPVGGRAYLDELRAEADRPGLPAHVLARLIRDAWERRRVIGLAEELIVMARHGANWRAVAAEIDALARGPA